MRKFIVGLSGLKRSGKDTVFNVIREESERKYVRQFLRYAFADPVRKITSIMFDWSIEEMNNPVFKETIDPRWGISPRQAMQYIGTDVGRIAIPRDYKTFAEVTGDSIWVKHFVHAVQKHPEYNWVLTDVRFQNEVDAVRNIAHENGYESIIIGIHRPEITDIDSHASEQGIMNIIRNADIQINNGGDLNDLRRKVQSVMSEYMREKSSIEYEKVVE